MTLKLLAAVALTALAASSAGAATLTVLGSVQDGDAYTNIAPASTTGTVHVGATGSAARQYADVYAGTDLVGATPFNAIRRNGSMSYGVAGMAGDSFTLIWGSVDGHNLVEFGDEAVSGTDLLGILGTAASGVANVIVRITAAGPFDDIRLSSGGNSFEHSFNPPELAAVPVPAGGLLLVAALGGLGIAARRRKAA